MNTLGNNIRAFIRYAGEAAPDPMHWLSGETSNSVNRTAEAVEVSDKRDPWARFIAGKRGGTIEITVYADKDSEAQTTMLENLAAGVPVEFLIGKVLADNEILGDGGIAIVTAVSDTNDFGAVASRTISLTVTEELDPSAYELREDDE